MKVVKIVFTVILAYVFLSIALTFIIPSITDLLDGDSPVIYRAVHVYSLLIGIALLFPAYFLVKRTKRGIPPPTPLERQKQAMRQKNWGVLWKIVVFIFCIFTFGLLFGMLSVNRSAKFYGSDHYY